MLRLIRGGLLLATTTLALGMAAGAVAVPAQAAPPQFAGPLVAPQERDPVAFKKLLTVRLDGRLVALKAYALAVKNSPRLSDGHEGTLRDAIDAEIKGLTELRTKVQGETTAAALKADAQSMVNDYRVYLLVRPQVHVAVGGDTATAAVKRLHDAIDKIGKALAKAKAAGKDTAAAEAKLAEAKGKVDAAEAGLAGVVDGLLTVEPGPDGEAIKGQTAAARGKVKAARAQLKSARADLKQLRDLVKKMI